MTDRESIIIIVILFVSFYFAMIYKPNDWQPIWTKTAKFDFSVVTYTIFYSNSRKSYKLETTGNRPTEREEYSEAVEKLRDYIFKSCRK
jgi:hypothetical protein